MKKIIFLLPLIVLAACASVSQASITDYAVTNDVGCAVTCTAGWCQPDQTLTIDGVQHTMHPGHILSVAGQFTADTADDPTLNIDNSILNDTGFTWTSYTIKYGVRAADGTTPLTNLGLTASVTAPADWTATVVQPLTLTASYTDADGNTWDNYYIGIINYTGPSSVLEGQTADLAFSPSFKGATSYVSWQEMTPVPEPATMVLLALGGLAILARRRRRS